MTKPKNLFITLLLLAGVGCTPTPQDGRQKNETPETVQREPGNGIYYWKTVFELNETERNFLEVHHVKRLYLRFFDVVPADKSINSDFDFEAVPNATIVFKDTVPDKVEIIPVIYITIDAFSPSEYHLFHLVKLPDGPGGKDGTQTVGKTACYGSGKPLKRFPWKTSIRWFTNTTWSC